MKTASPIPASLLCLSSLGLVTAATSAQTYTVPAGQDWQLDVAWVDTANANILGTLGVGTNGLLSANGLFDVRGLLQIEPGGWVTGGNSLKVFQGGELHVAGGTLDYRMPNSHPDYPPFYSGYSTGMDVKNEGLFRVTDGRVIPTGFDNRETGRFEMSGGLLLPISTSRLFDNRGSFEMTGGTLSNVRSFKTFPGSDLLLAGGELRVRQFKNEGSATQTGGELRASSFENRSTSDFTLDGGKTSLRIPDPGDDFLEDPIATNDGIMIVTDGEFEWGSYPLSIYDSRFENGLSGTLSISGSGGVEAEVVDNRGEIQVSGGFSSDFDFVDRFTNHPDAIFTVSGGRVSGASWFGDHPTLFDNLGSMTVNAGRLESVWSFKNFPGGSVTLTGGTISVEQFKNEQDVTINGGDLEVGEIIENRAGAMIRMNGGTISRPGPIGDIEPELFDNFGTLEIERGFVSGVDSFINFPGGQVDLGVGSSIFQALLRVSEFKNEGTTTVESNGYLEPIFLLDNRPGATLRVEAGGIVRFAAPSVSSRLIDNHATIVVDAGSIAGGSGFASASSFKTFLGSTTQIINGGDVHAEVYRNEGMTTIASQSKLAAGEVQVRSGSEIRIDADGVLQTPHAFIDAGGTLRIHDAGTVDLQNGSMPVLGDVIVTGSVSVTNAGPGGISLNPGGTLRTIDGASLFADVSGTGTIQGADSSSLTLEGSVSPGSNSDANIAAVADVTLGNGAVLHIDILSETRHDALVHTGGMLTLGGTLRINTAADYSASEGQVFVIVTSTNEIAGQFDTIDAPSLPNNLGFAAEYGLNTTRLVVTNQPCSAADLAQPFGDLNFFDIAEYIARFTAADPSADLAAPFGTLNFFDVTTYLSTYNAGCP